METLLAYVPACFPAIHVVMGVFSHIPVFYIRAAWLLP
jgi:hypothetical protein